MSSHTPGPWNVTNYSIVEAEGFRVATCFSGRPECADNARLIAQAPALLEAAKELLLAIDAENWVNAVDLSERIASTVAVDALEQAVRKAEGRE